MSETHPAKASDLDRIGDRIERAAAVVRQLREERDRLVRERDALAKRVRELEARNGKGDAGALARELSGFRAKEREWAIERREVASRIEALLRKLDKLDNPAV